jgi:hypothetical protein
MRSGDPTHAPGALLGRRRLQHCHAHRLDAGLDRWLGHEREEREWLKASALPPGFIEAATSSSASTPTKEEHRRHAGVDECREVLARRMGGTATTRDRRTQGGPHRRWVSAVSTSTTPMWSANFPTEPLLLTPAKHGAAMRIKCSRCSGRAG